MVRAGVLGSNSNAGDTCHNQVVRPLRVGDKHIYTYIAQHNMASFEHKKTKIAMPESLYQLRINKQVGMFAVGMLDASEPASIATYGRGKWIEYVISNAETDLYGTIGKAKDKKWCVVSCVITAAEDKRLPAGLLLHFPIYGIESNDLSTMQAEAEIQAIFGEVSPKVIRMEFNKAVSTQYGSTIKPPVLSVRDCDKREQLYFEAAQIIPVEYPQFIPEATELFPPVYDDVTGKLISGLSRSAPVAQIPVLPGASQSKLPA